MYQRAHQLREENSCVIESLDDFKQYFTPENADKPEIHGGFAHCHFTENAEVEKLLKEMKVTIRCIPLADEKVEGTCIFTGQPTTQRAVFGKAY